MGKHHRGIAYALTIFIGFGLGCASNASVSPNASPLDEQQQRRYYTQALDFLKKGHRQRFESKLEHLNNYPLYRYLLYYDYRRNLSKTGQDKLLQFTETYNDSPVAKRLHRKLLNHLAKNKRWADYLEAYKRSPSTPSERAKDRCNVARALYNVGNKAASFDEAESLWLVGKSQHKACDPIFTAWKSSNDFDRDAIRARIALAMNAQQTQLVGYLAKLLDTKERKRITEWQSVFKNPQRLSNTKRYLHDRDWIDQAIVRDGFKRLFRKDYDLAAELWPTYAPYLAAEHRAEFYYHVAIWMSYRHDQPASLWLKQALLFYPDEGKKRERILQTGLRVSLRHQDWYDVLTWLKLLPKTEQVDDFAMYWRSRAIAALQNGLLDPVLHRARQTTNASLFYLVKPGETPRLTNSLELTVNRLIDESRQPVAMLDSLLPEELLQQIALNRSYYGFLASEQLGWPLSLNNDASTHSKEALARIKQLPGIHRSRELDFVNDPFNSRSEWHHALNALSPDERHIASQVAHLWGWHTRAIFAAAKASNRNNLQIRFPRVHANTVVSNAKQKGIDSDWVFSLIRQESAFMPDAKSSAGALGIMQIMPNTAKHISKKVGMRYRGKHSLLNPQHNIDLGTSYLKQLMERFDGNILVATAAYNAGPHRAKRWLPEKEMAGDIWIETIPFDETRSYVKNIMTYQAIYRHHAGLANPRISQALALVTPKR